MLFFLFKPIWYPTNTAFFIQANFVANLGGCQVDQKVQLVVANFSMESLWVGSRRRKQVFWYLELRGSMLLHPHIALKWFRYKVNYVTIRSTWKKFLYFVTLNVQFTFFIIQFNISWQNISLLDIILSKIMSKMAILKFILSKQRIQLHIFLQSLFMKIFSQNFKLWYWSCFFLMQTLILTKLRYWNWIVH